MESQKCIECGLMNWIDRELCKRCEEPLRKLNGQPNTIEKRGIVETPTLLTVNGIGTRLMGWRHYKDGTGSTTVWFSVMYLPIFPISRYRIVSQTSAELEPEISSGPLKIFSPYKSSSTTYLFLGRIPLSGVEVLRTYLFAYLWLPIKLIAPGVIMLKVMTSNKSEIESATQLPTLVIGGLMMVWLAYIMFVTGRLLQRSRGAVN